MDLKGYKNFKVLHESDDHVIYSALREDGTAVVLKSLRTEQPSLDDITLIYHEYEISRDLDLPGVIKTYDLIEEHNNCILVQENIQGISLQEYIQKNPLKKLSDFFQLAIPMVRNLDDLHQQNIIHKNIKPGNYIIHPKSVTEKLTDLEVASKLLHEIQEIVPPKKLEGTLEYMSPEQTGRMNMNIDYRSDFYALGVSFYEMLTGKLPFSYQDPLEIIHAHLANPMPPLYNPHFEIPTILEKILEKLMRKNPRDRYQSGVGIIADLEKCEKAFEKEGKVDSFILGQEDVFEHLNLSEKLYGREIESETLIAAYHRVSQGAVEGLMVCGYSGIGKTMLINEVHKPMVKHKGYFISGKFDQLQRNTPYTAIKQAFNQLARSILAEPEDRFKAIKKGMQDELGSVGQVMVDLAPDLELILGPQSPLEQLPPEENQNRIMIFFKRFLHAVASSDHPLVLFIDDLQWIDSGSLKLFEYIMTDDELHHFLLIGAYRDNEVDEQHPLSYFFKKMKEEERIINKLSLKNLKSIDFEHFFMDSFNRNQADVKPFADLIHKRTNGNPFFCKQFIRALYKDNLLYFDLKERKWNWKLEDIITLKITDNVVDLMLRKLAELPAESQDLLRYAACVGSRFTVEMLMTISEKSADEISSLLWPALQNELIITLRLGHKRSAALSRKDIGDSLSKEITYQFIHDRVQQAAYQGIPTKEKQKIHLSIARLLMEKESSKNESLFEITDHFNIAHELLTNNEKILIANLNYEASLRAQNASAYQPMLNYLTAAKSLMTETWWTMHYDLAFNVNRSYALGLFIVNKSEESEALIKTLLVRAKTNLEKVSLYRIQIMSFYKQGEFNKLFEAAQIALNLLGVNLVLSPSKMQILAKLLFVDWRLRRHHIETLDKELPAITDPALIAAFEILNELLVPAFLKSIELHSYTVLIGMDLLLRCGKPPRGAGAIWLTDYTVLTLYVFKNINHAFRCWEGAQKLMAESSDKYTAPIAYQAAAQLLNHLRNPIKAAEPYCQLAMQYAMNSGNIMALAHPKLTLFFVHLAEAKSLSETIALGKLSNKAYKEIDFRGLIELSEIYILTLENLQADAEGQKERLTELENILSGGEISLLFATAMRQLSFYYYFKEDFEKANYYHNLWYAHEDKIRFDIFTYEVKAINALALAKYPAQKSQFRQLLKEIKWIAQNCPGNYLHHYLFLKGTEAQLKGNFPEALRDFHEAIENAKKQDLYLWVALGNELAAELIMAHNWPQAAIAYVQEAFYYYERYGMRTKTRALEKRYPQYFRGNIVTQKGSMHVGSGATSVGLDFMSIIKASQAISGEIILEKLFEKILHIAAENAGAEKAVFLEQHKNNWMVTASLRINQGISEFQMLNQPLKEFSDLPKTIIQYALRSRKLLVLNNPIEDDQYQQDDYIAHIHPKSILCLPVLRQDVVIGIIYLENNLTADVFVEARVEVLKTLASQMSISLENARNFERMENLYRSTERFVPKSFLNLLKKETIEEIKVGDSIEVNLAPLFADIRNFTTISETLGTEKTALLLNAYMQKMSPIIRRNHGFVSQFLGDGIMALFSRNYNDAVLAAVQMREALPEFNKAIKAQGYEPIQIGIGINAGPAMLITLGEEERIDASVVSDVVNAAARIEGLNKWYGTGLLLSGSVYDAIKNPESYPIRLVDKIKVQGKNNALRVYEILTLNKGEDFSKVRTYVDDYENAFKYYEAKDFKSALQGFVKCLVLRPEDSAAAILKKRCETFLASGVPENWDGTYTARKK